MCKTTIFECRYCDGMMSYYNSSYEAVLCSSCGAEWDPIEVPVEEESQEVCAECKIIYAPSGSNAQSKLFYCSSSCEERYHSCYCETCNNHYDQRESQALGGFSYCSEVCEEEAYEAVGKEQ